MSKAWPRLIWAMVVIVLLIALVRWVTTRPHRSNDQKILLQKAK